MWNAIKKWIFRMFCFGTKEDGVTDSFPCYYCKHYDKENDECKLYKALKIKE